MSLKNVWNEEGCSREKAVESKRRDSLQPNTNTRQTKRKGKLDRPLEEEEFYHGLMPREDIQQMLRNNGDFLVRYTEVPPDNTKSYVLSVRHANKNYHFVIKQKENKKYTVLETLEFDSIGDLVRMHLQKALPLSNTGKSAGAMLKNPVPREQWELRHNQIRMEHKMGEGAFGEVYKGTLLWHGHPMAVAIKKSHAKGLSKKQLQDMMKESRLMRRYNHPNVVKLYGVAAEQEPVLFVMELITGGSLDKFLRKHGALLGTDMLYKFCLDAARGLEYLHSKNCIHRDVAARNCLINEQQVVKISDFGLSFEGDAVKMTNTQKVPIKWLSIETLTSAVYSTKSDVWAYGVLVWEVFNQGQIPYPGMSPLQVAQKVRQGYRMPAPPNMPEALRVIMVCCWETIPDQRPAFTQIVRHLSHQPTDQPASTTDVTAVSSTS